jgi:hypothetical protein
MHYFPGDLGPYTIFGQCPRQHRPPGAGVGRHRYAAPGWYHPQLHQHHRAAEGEEHCCCGDSGQALGARQGLPYTPHS